MVASISARKNIRSVAAYYSHLKKDDYYSAAADESGYWRGRAAQILGLEGQVSRETFRRALNGQDPLNVIQLVASGRNSKKHQPGWDICLSAPKAVSIVWALAQNAQARNAVLNAHQRAVQKTCREIEDKYGFCRRGKGGRKKEPTAGLLFAAFDHKTSRLGCPQLHSHIFTFNMAPRRDTTWGAILSQPFYKAQKDIGHFYRKQLQQELLSLKIPARIEDDTIRIEGISRDAELAFSLRRQEILNAVDRYGYSRTAKGFEQATLRTRSKKQAVPFERLHSAWQERAQRLQLRVPQPTLPETPVKKQQNAKARPKTTLKKPFIGLFARAVKFAVNQKIETEPQKSKVKQASRSLFRWMTGVLPDTLTHALKLGAPPRS